MQGALRRGRRQKNQGNHEVSSMVNVSAEGQVYLCEICGNRVKVLEVGGGELVCCGEPMALVEE
jgi:desulfoferrodoxin-like iron-binding protein